MLHEKRVILSVQCTSTGSFTRTYTAESRLDCGFLTPTWRVMRGCRGFRLVTSPPGYVVGMMKQVAGPTRHARSRARFFLSSYQLSTFIPAVNSRSKSFRVHKHNQSTLLVERCIVHVRLSFTPRMPELPISPVAAWFHVACNEQLFVETSSTLKVHDGPASLFLWPFTYKKVSAAAPDKSECALKRVIWLHKE